jgi:hypothetical protein
MLVVDLSGDVAGRFCAKLLGMGGATVVGPARADGWLDRYLGRSTTVVTDPWEHVARADVVVTSFDAGAYDGGFDRDRVHEVNQSAVHVTTSTFGTTGHTLGCDRCKEGSSRPGEDVFLPEAIRMLREDPDSGVRAAAATTLGQSAATRRSDVAKALVAARDGDPDRHVRKVAARFVKA